MDDGSNGFELIFKQSVTERIIEDIAIHQPHGCTRREVLARLGYDLNAGGANTLRFDELVEKGFLTKTTTVPPGYRLASHIVGQYVEVCTKRIERSEDVLDAILD